MITTYLYQFIRKRETLWGMPAILWQTIFFLFPFLFLFYLSFWILEDYIPKRGFSLNNYRIILTDSIYWRNYFNSLLIAISSTITITLISIPIAYYIAYHVKKNLQFLLVLIILLPLLTSYILRIYSWQILLAKEGIVNYIMLSLGLIHEPLSLLFSKFAILIGLVSYYSSLMILILFASMYKTDREIILAAHNLGAGNFTILYKIIIPIIRPSLIIGMLFIFIFTFGDFVVPSLLGGSNVYTLSIQLFDIGKENDWPRAAALAVIMSTTIFGAFILSFIFFKRKKLVDA